MAGRKRGSIEKRPSAAPAAAGSRDPAEPIGPARVSSTVEALALSVGHDINNPLAALMANLALVVEVLRDEHRDADARTTEALALLGEVRLAAERINAVVQRLRATALPTLPPPSAPGPILSMADPTAEASPRRVRVLVVDDDVLVGQALKRSLREYDVVVLGDARGALVRVAAGERFDVIFCDLMMPDMTGMDLYEEVLRAAPDQAERMIFLTGGATTTRARDFVATVPNPVLDKPFDVKKLREIIRVRMGARAK
jgi:CheY-like chemotaxis protein